MDNRRPPLLHAPHEFLREMCKHAVDRSQGQLVDITIVGFGDDDLLWYIAGRSSQLKRLETAHCYFTNIKSWTEVLKKISLLEELSLNSTPISKKAIQTAARCCPLLKTLKVNQESKLHANSFCNETAIAIGENFREVRHLELIGNSLTNIGLQVILDGCRHLESLDLRCTLTLRDA